MALKVAIVGLPNVGKSTLFNALTQTAAAQAANYPFCTIEPNTGDVAVPEPRLEKLAQIAGSKEVIPSRITFVDIAGLVRGASKGEGLGNQFLANIREVDAVVYVLRAFDDGEVPGPADPLEHLRVVELELTLADLESVENQVTKRRKAAKADKSLADEVAALDAAEAVLSEGTPIYRSDLDDEVRALLRPYFLLTNRPVLALVNVGEDQLDDVASVVAPVEAELEGRAEVLGMCVQLEAEAAQLTMEERAEMLEALGLGEGALPRFLHAAYHLLGLRTFFTTGEKESRAWTFRAGWKAPQCAGVIHTDFEKGFIRAEVIHWDELVEIGSWSKARDVGKLRVEGKDYIVQEGDVLLCQDGERFAVRAASETLSEVRGDDTLLLTRAAYHLGNRHVALAIKPGVLRYQHDHVLDAMVQGLGLPVSVVHHPFTPEAGAYATAHSHAHHHQNDHHHQHDH